jgi:UDP-GlcNAc:undecaprenyl-phosphate GlcNAc-1-phosphate transferase
MTVYLALVCVFSAAMISALITALVRRWSRSHGFVDRPGGHKTHSGEIPLGGGIAIVAAVVLPMLLVLTFARIFGTSGAETGWLPPDWLPAFIRIHLSGLLSKSAEGTGIVAGAIVLHVLGLIDDMRSVSAGIKFAVQVGVAAFLALWLDMRILSHLGLMPSALFTIVWIVLITNAFNFLDNMDGLAAGIGVIVAAVYSCTAVLGGQLFVPACCWLLVGALLGFLPFNRHPASIYLGDSGSTVIGYLIAVFTILTTFYDPSQGHRPIGVIAPIIVVAVPLYDTLSVFFLRWRSGRPIWAADRRHFSHRLVRAGMPPPRAVAVIWLATLATALPAVVLPQVAWPVAIGILAQTFAIVSVVALMESGAHDRAR